ncbi:Ubiquitin specific protease domain [Sesbania bispinosa]|nr:Ubiquitin specific protease domain [Sesbania bispinosa]
MSFSSRKCQVAHWFQGHKEECRAPSTTQQADDLVSDLGKKVAEPDYCGIHDEKSQFESTEYTTITSSEKPPLFDLSYSPKISCAKMTNDPLPSHSNESLPKSVGNNVPSARSASLENEGVDSSGWADASTIYNLQTVGSKGSNHVMLNAGSNLKSAEIRCPPLQNVGNNGIQSGTATSSQIASCSPNSKNGLKTSVAKVVDQFRESNLSKHVPLAVGSDIAGKYSDKVILELTYPFMFFCALRNHYLTLSINSCCYANAVLQCLAFTPPLTAYLLQGLHSNHVCANKKWCFICEFEGLLLKAKDTKSPLSPMGIISQLRILGANLDSLKEETNIMGLTLEAIFDQRCKSYQKAKKKMTVSEAPNVLTIALKRFKFGKYGKLNKPIRFPEILNLAPFISETSDLAIYRLYGTKAVNATASTWNKVVQEWKLQDNLPLQNPFFRTKTVQVTAVDLETVLTKGAYMLLYARCSPRAPRINQEHDSILRFKSKVNGKAVTMKSRYVSSDSVVRRSMTSFDSSDGFSCLRDYVLAVTDSTCDSTSTDDFADHIFGNSGVEEMLMLAPHCHLLP